MSHQNFPFNIWQSLNKKFSPTEYDHIHTSTDEWFFLQPPRSAYTTLFIGTRLGEILQTMSFAKSVPEGLKLSECKWGIGGKNLPICYIQEKDPVQEALKKSKKTNYFKLTLPHMGSEFKVAL